MGGKAKSARRKRCTRIQRLAWGSGWIQDYNGKNLIAGYAKHFAVDKPCAIKELELLGVYFTPEHKAQVVNAHNRMVEQRKKLKKSREQAAVSEFARDENFACIIGYTSGGAPYGVTWEEDEKYNRLLQQTTGDDVSNDIYAFRDIEGF